MADTESGLEGRTTLIRAAHVVDAAGSMDDGWVLLNASEILAVGNGPDAPAASDTVDLGAMTLVPGFIDMHGHGGAGGAFDGSAADIAQALTVHRQHGTTRSVLSLVANPIESLVASLSTIRAVMTADPLVLGAHLEGPFLAPDNHGAHEPEFLMPPTASALGTLLEAGQGVLRQITIAPELPGALDAIRRIVDGGVVAAVGHTMADASLARQAFDAGATVLTHAFNAMPGIHHRRPGPVVAAIGDDRVTLELILDGVHVDLAVGTLLFRAAPDRVALVTDAMAATGSGDGDYELGSLAVRVADGVARLAGSDTIAGSTLTQDAALRNAVLECGVPLRNAVAALTAVPAAALGIGRRHGAIAAGNAADLVALDDDLRVRAVWADGALLHQK